MNLEDKEIEVYGKVYEVAEKIMKKETVEISYSREVFLCTVGHRADQVDISRWKDLDNEDFINIAYLELLRRFPLIEDIKYWLSQPEYKKRLISTIMSSSEFLALHIEVLNNPYKVSGLKNKIKRLLYKESEAELKSSWYYKLYSKFPPKIRIALKKILGII